MNGQPLPPGAISPTKLLQLLAAQGPAPPIAPPPTQPVFMDDCAAAMVGDDWFDRAAAVAEERRRHGSKAGPWLSAEQRRRVRRQLDRERQERQR